MGAPQTRLLRGYGPLVAAAVLFVLMATLVPTVGKQVETRTVVGGAAGTPLGEGSTGTDPGVAGETAGEPGSAGGVVSRARARPGTTPGKVVGCPDRKLQVPGDPYSPPCVAFSGDNGGATTKGVSATTINVSSRILADTQSFLDTINQITGGKITTTAEEARRTFFGLVDYFNSRFQFYGRKLKVDLFDGKGTATAELLGGGQEEAEADAVKVAEELKAFADISSFTVPYADALSRRKVVNIGAPYMSREWFVARRPYAWSEFTDCSILTESTTDYGNKRLQGRPAAFAGGDLKGKMRKFDRLEAAVRMLRKARNDIAVIHPPAVLAFEVLPDVAAAERRLRAELVVARGIEIDVMDAEQKRVVRLPALAEGIDANDRVHLRSVPARCKGCNGCERCG